MKGLTRSTVDRKPRNGVRSLQSGTLDYNSTFNHYGTLAIPSGTVLRLNGGGTATSALDNNSGGLVEWTTDYSLNTGAQLKGPGLYKHSRGTLNVNTNMAVQNFDLYATLAGASTVTVSNVMNWTSGSMSGAGGRTVIAVGATLNLISGGLSLSDRTLDNAGTVNHTGNGFFFASVVTNRPGALWDVQADVAFNPSDSLPRFDNAGTFRKRVSAGTVSFNGIPFNNYGTVDVQSGTVNFNGGYTQTGGILSFGISSLTNFGRINIAGNAPLTGTLNINLRNGYQPGLSDTFQVMTYSSRTGTFSAVTGCSIGIGFFFDPIYESTQLLLAVRDGTPHLDSAKMSMIDGQFRFRLTTGFAGQTYIIQASTTLTNWIPISTNTLPNCVLDFVDTDSVNFPHRFYRALLVP